MPLPSRQLEAIVEQALEKAGVLPPREEASEALKSAGIDIQVLASQLANIIFTAKDSVKLKAIEQAFALHGISIKPEAATQGTPQIIFNVTGENVNLNSLFAPERNI